MVIKQLHIGRSSHVEIHTGVYTCTLMANRWAQVQNPVLEEWKNSNENKNGLNT